MAQIQEQLSKLLGRKVKQVRKTDEVPPRISVIDVVVVITGKDANHAAQDVGYVKDRHPEVTQILGDFKFRGQGQKKTPVTDLRGAVELTFLLPGRHAARVRRQAAELLCRYLGGDLSLVDEVCRIRGFQAEMAVQRPEDPRRIFGEAVEAAGGTNGGARTTELARACTEAIANAVPGIIEKLSAHIDERLAQDRQRVNLNVRAPKRPLPRDPLIARDIAAARRPFPVAKFLDAKEREDPAWRETRRSFAPTFGMIVQVLKKSKLKEEGLPAVYVEQNQRPQLLYTEDDRELMEEAWKMTTAHREELVSRLTAQVAPIAPAALPAPVPPAVPRVLAMLQGGI